MTREKDLSVLVPHWYENFVAITDTGIKVPTTELTNKLSSTLWQYPWYITTLIVPLRLYHCFGFL